MIAVCFTTCASIIFSSPANVPMDATTSSQSHLPTDSLPSINPGVIAGEYTMCMHCNAIVVLVYACMYINFLYLTGIVVITGVLLLLVAVTSVVVLLFIMLRRKHSNKQGNSCTCTHNKGRGHSHTIRPRPNHSVHVVHSNRPL